MNIDLHKLYHGNREIRTGVANLMNGRPGEQGHITIVNHCDGTWTLESWSSPFWVSCTLTILYIWLLNMQLGRLKTGCIASEKYRLSKRNQSETLIGH